MIVLNTFWNKDYLQTILPELDEEGNIILEPKAVRVSHQVEELTH